ncbi:outer membrane beta-barrel protein [Thiofilum flexile]|uniref:outer membrane beta-barrel protein n=1 Tax=Thiofilum flexile TaxID=125627 RepID=UPI000371BC09|nr:outer membrane beta-barrel protein [Thiofilum flexile]
MKLVLPWLAAAAISLLAPFCYADYYSDAFDSSEPRKPDINLSGLYAGASAGIYQTGCLLSDDNCRSGAWKVYGGYDITEKVSLELAYHNLGTIEDLDITGTAASGVVTLPTKKPGLSMIGKVGAIKLNAKGDVNVAVGTSVITTGVKKSLTGLLIGGGTEFEVDDNWKIRTEYEHIGGDHNLGLFSVGVGYSSL